MVDQITILFNIRINDQKRADLFRNLLIQLVKLPNLIFSIRIRGDLQDQVILDCKDILKNNKCIKTRILIGSSYKDWCLDLLEQVALSPSEYFLIIPEDHQFISTIPFLDETLNDICENSVDFLALSFYPHYEIFVKNLIARKPKLSISDYINYWDLQKWDIKSIPRSHRNYLLNLAGAYKKDLLVKVLVSNRPLLKKFSKETPFNFEQPPSQYWFLPIRWGYPKSELFACVDDDHSIPGYSLNSRRKLAGSQERVIEHHDEYANKKTKTSKWIKSKINIDWNPLFRTLDYNFNFYKDYRLRKNIIRKILNYGNDC